MSPAPAVAQFLDMRLPTRSQRVPFARNVVVRSWLPCRHEKKPNLFPACRDDDLNGHAYVGLYVDRARANAVVRTKHGRANAVHERRCSYQFTKTEDQNRAGRRQRRSRHCPRNRSHERRAQVDLRFQVRPPPTICFRLAFRFLRTPPGFARSILQDNKVECLRYLCDSLRRKLILWISL
jgi:hypothetical protein